MDAQARRRSGRASIAAGVASLVACGALAYAWVMDLADDPATMRFVGVTLALGLVSVTVGRIMLRESVRGGAPGGSWPRDEEGRMQWPCHACDAFNLVDYGFCLRCGTVAKGDRVQVAAAGRRAQRV